MIVQKMILTIPILNDVNNFYWDVYLCDVLQYIDNSCICHSIKVAIFISLQPTLTLESTVIVKWLCLFNSPFPSSIEIYIYTMSIALDDCE